MQVYSQTTLLNFEQHCAFTFLQAFFSFLFPSMCNFQHLSEGIMHTGIRSVLISHFIHFSDCLVFILFACFVQTFEQKTGRIIFGYLQCGSMEVFIAFLFTGQQMIFIHLSGLVSQHSSSVSGIFFYLGIAGLGLHYARCFMGAGWLFLQHYSKDTRQTKGRQEDTDQSSGLQVLALAP